MVFFQSIELFIYHPKHKMENTKDKTIITNIPYAILNICLISDIFAKISSFSSRNVRRFNFISYICTAFKKQYESNNLIYQYHEEDQFF